MLGARTAPWQVTQTILGYASLSRHRGALSFVFSADCPGYCFKALVCRAPGLVGRVHALKSAHLFKAMSIVLRHRTWMSLLCLPQTNLYFCRNYLDEEESCNTGDA